MSEIKDSPIESILTAVNRVRDAELTGRMYTLGDLIGKLEAVDPSLPVEFVYPEDTNERLKRYRYDDKYDENTVGVGSFESYRGYYEFLSIRPQEKITTVAEVLKNAREAVGKTYEGYKGGDYTMDRSTFIWCSHHGDASGLMITDAKIRNKNTVVIFTAFEPEIDFSKATERIGKQWGV